MLYSYGEEERCQPPQRTALGALGRTWKRPVPLRDAPGGMVCQVCIALTPALPMSAGRRNEAGFPGTLR
jgi:hypothetical protein